MKTTNESLKVVNHEDAEQSKSILQRVAALNAGDELDPTRLMDLLGDIDGIKREIHERMRRIDAVKEAKSFLMEEAARTETLNRRLSEMTSLMNAVQPGPLPVNDLRDASATAEVRANSGRTPGEGVAIAWPKSENPQEPSPGLTEPSANGAGILATDTASSQWNELVKHGEHGEQASGDAQAFQDISMIQSVKILEEAQTLLTRAQAVYQEATDKQAKISTELQTAHKDLALAYESAGRRLAEAEQFRKEAAETIANAEATFEQAEAMLAEARSRAEAAGTELQTSRQELTTAYQFASLAGQRRIESSELFERAARWSVFASLFSWVGTVWMAWLALVAFHYKAPILLPALGTVIVLLAGAVLIKRKVRNKE